MKLIDDISGYTFEMVGGRLSVERLSAYRFDSSKPLLKMTEVRIYWKQFFRCHRARIITAEVSDQISLGA